MLLYTYPYAKCDVQKRTRENDKASFIFFEIHTVLETVANRCATGLPREMSTGFDCTMIGNMKDVFEFLTAEALSFPHPLEIHERIM